MRLPYEEKLIQSHNEPLWEVPTLRWCFNISEGSTRRQKELKSELSEFRCLHVFFYVLLPLR